MMKSLQKTACALAVLAVTTSSAFAADSVELKVTGTISPVACKPVLGGGGTVDYGTIAANTLSKDSYTVLDERSVDFSITCDAPAKVAVWLANGQPADSAAGAGTPATTGFAPKPAGVTFKTASKGYVAGLGLSGTQKIGGYNAGLTVGSFSSDGASRDLIWQNAEKPDSAWSKSAEGTLMNNYKELITVAKTGSILPEPFTIMTGKLYVQAYINKASELDLTQPVTLDGLSTIELVYL